MKRKAISKRSRFEVFKRDSFKCQYCGKSAPDVLLQVDHIHPVAKGGAGDITNLITACEDCNAGKSDKLLSDTSVAVKRKAQADQLQERREQITMMAEWQRGLLDVEALATMECVRLWNDQSAFVLNSKGELGIRKLVKKYGMVSVMDAVNIATSRYLPKGDQSSHEDFEFAFKKVGGICVVAARTKENPHLPEAYRIRSTLRGLCGGLTPWQDRMAIDFLSLMLSYGHSPEEIRELLVGVNRWSKFELLAISMGAK